jgi:hypothetical protein
MQSNSVSKSSATRLDRRFNWIAAVFLGIPGLYEAIKGSMEGNTGEALYGLGKAVCGVFFLLQVLNPASLQNRRAKVLVGSLIYVGLAIAIFGFLLKRGIL